MIKAIHHLLACGVVAALLTPGFSRAAELALFDPAQSPAPAKLEAWDAKISPPAEGFLFHLSTGHAERWPGIVLPAPQGKWDLSAYHRIVMRVRNTGTSDAVLHCRVDNAGADGIRHCVNSSIFLPPGRTGTLTVGLTRPMDKLNGKLFGMLGYPGGSGAAGIEPSAVTGLVLFLKTPEADHEIEIGPIRVEGERPANIPSVTDATPFFPFVDTFGQYKHLNWPGKTLSLDDLHQKQAAETKELVAQPCQADWDLYGGWEAGPHLPATGFFRTEQYQGKWWLVDPEGRLFFSQGIDCVRMLNATPVEERETWFEDFPGKRPEFQAFFSTGRGLHGHYAGRTPQCFSFRGANLLRKYGPGWEDTYRTIAHQRLRSWGFNTIGNWSEEEIRRMHRTPYVDTLDSGATKRIEASEGFWSKFPDVFDPGFAQTMSRVMAEKKGKSAGDPWCIGYFSDNEMGWGSSISLALGTLQSPATQPAKIEFVADLKAKYGEIERLNAAWGTQHATWDALLASRQAPDKKKAREDLSAFYLKLAETYFRTMQEVIKAVAPQQLYLGCRFAGVNPLAARAANRYCDVVSYNIYQPMIADSQFVPGEKPILIGEFHFGALDRGMFHTGLVPVANQAERAQAYKAYMMEAARHPLFVGAHWFQFMDEPLTGRPLDEENFQIGFVDIADTPYPEMVRVSREVAAEMYRARAGQ